MKTKLTGPSINRHRSKQDYSTPPEFISAVKDRFGPLHHDLAASKGNAQAVNYYDEKNSAFVHTWHWTTGTLWLNPPFGNIAPWAEKCAEEASEGARILLLVPASVDSNWWAEYVHHKAAVLFLNPRLSFDGKNPYPKPCALCCYGFIFGDLHNLMNWYEPWYWARRRNGV